jgi:hypothetical protein
VPRPCELVCAYCKKENYALVECIYKSKVESDLLSKRKIMEAQVHDDDVKAGSSAAETSHGQGEKNYAIMVFSPSLIHQLSTKKGRLEATYVGVRRVRPSSKMVHKALLKTGTTRIGAVVDNASSLQDDAGALKGTKDDATTPIDISLKKDNGRQDHSKVIYRIMGEDGVERRMNTQEKKALKSRLRQERALAKKQQKHLQRQQLELLQKQQNQTENSKRGEKRPLSSVGGDVEGIKNEEGEPDKANCSTKSNKDNKGDGDSEETFVNAIDKLSKTGIQSQDYSLLEQELADLRGERHGVPPVILSPPLAQAACRHGGILSGSMSNDDDDDNRQGQKKEDLSFLVDDHLAERWADALKQSMLPAEEVRDKEDMRSMAYELVPEVWTRLRPESLNSTSSGGKTSSCPGNSLCLSSTTASQDLSLRESKPASLISNRHESQKRGELWGYVSIRPPLSSTFDADLAIVAEAIYQRTSFHLSCGAKFGCDLLLYDGPRSERHAFAGLRLVVQNKHKLSTAFPLPSAYSLAAYVRCLNTAGKLALLATVRREQGRHGDATRCCHVAFVDLKLQRVDGTKRKNMDVRLKKLHRSTASL